MNKSLSLLLGGLLASPLFWEMPTARGQEIQPPVESMIFRIATEDGSYCHLRFPTLREDTLAWERPVFNEGPAVIDFYGPCNYDPLGQDEIQAQRRVIQRGYDEGDE